MKNYSYIKDHPYYIIFETGKVFSLKKNIFLKISLNKDGYKRVSLKENGKLKNMLLHRLLGLHFISNLENKPCIDHIDRNRQNNDLSNLRWATYSENSINITTKKNNIYTAFRGKYEYWYIKIMRNGKLYEKRLNKTKYSYEEAILYKDAMLEDIV